MKSILESKTSTGVRKVIENAVLESKWRYKPCQSQNWNWVEGDIEALKRNSGKTQISILDDVYQAAYLDVYNKYLSVENDTEFYNITSLVKDLYDVERINGNFILGVSSDVTFYSTGLPEYSCNIWYEDESGAIKYEEELGVSEGQGAGELWTRIKQLWLNATVKDIVAEQKTEAEAKIQKIGEIAINVLKNYVVHNLDCADVSAVSDEDYMDGGGLYIDFKQIENTPISIYGEVSNQLDDSTNPRLLVILGANMREESVFEELGFVVFTYARNIMLYTRDNDWAGFKKNVAQKLQQSDLISKVYKLLDYYEEHGEIESMFK